MKTLLSPEDHVIGLTPCYQSLKSIPESICNVDLLNLSIAAEWALDIDKLKSLIQPGKTKAIIINFPHNPTGSLITKEEQFALVNLAKQFDLWIFSDEVYRGLEIDEELTLPPISCVYSKGISLGGTSKVYGLAGLRVGWICCQDIEFLEAMGESKHYLSICNSAPSEVLTLIALRSKDVIIGRNKDIIKDNLKIMDVFMTKHADSLSWHRPKGGCCGLVKINNLPPTMTLDVMTTRLVNEFGVLILPGSQFPVSPKSSSSSSSTETPRDPRDIDFEYQINHHFRIGFGRKSFPVALQVFEDALFNDKYVEDGAMPTNDNDAQAAASEAGSGCSIS